MLLGRSISSAAGDFLKPGKGELGYALPDPSGEAEGYSLCDTMGKFGILANGVEEGIEGWMGAATVSGKGRGRERAF